uniref:tetratricopeptide repeat protein n=1 Tax=Candidatus Electrothrix sp. TaxID=2170559 RepID=UPI004057244F
MNSMNTWIEHLHHPLVFAGFGLFLLALLLRPLFLNNKKLTGTATERLLSKGMILVFILALLSIIGGVALSWKATPEALPEKTTDPSLGLQMQQYEERLKKVEQQLLAKQASGTVTDEKERHLLEAQLKAVQEKLANLQQSYEGELERRKAADKALTEMKGELPEARIVAAQKSLDEGDAEAAEQVFDEVVEKEGKSVALAAYQSGQLAEGRLDYAKAMRQYTKAVTLEEDNPDYLLAAGVLASTLADYDRAQDWLQPLLNIREAEGKDDVELANAQVALAHLYSRRYNYKNAESLLRSALSIREKKSGKSHPSVALILNNIGFLYANQERNEESVLLYERALEIAERPFFQDYSLMATVFNNLAMLYRDQGRNAEAEPLLKRALKINEKAFGKDHPTVATTLNNLATLYDDQGCYEEAETLYRRALEISEKALKKDHPSVATILNNLAVLYNTQGRYDEVEPLFKRSLKIYEKTLGKDHPSVAITLNNLAALYESQSRYEEAEPYYKRTLEIWEKSLGKEHSKVATSLNNLAGLYQIQGHYEEAEPLYRHAIAIMKKKSPDDHPNLDTLQANYDLLKQKMTKQ